MTYFKIISDDSAVDAGFLWLKWDARHGFLVCCEPHEAHYAESYNEQSIYRVEWLNPLPPGAPSYPTAKAVVIDAVQYDELVATLSSGETVPELGPVQETSDPIPDTGSDHEQQRPMTVAEMRVKLMELEETLNIIMGVME